MLEMMYGHKKQAKKDQMSYISTTVQRLWLVRHGETTCTHERRYCGHHDAMLNATGTRQARWLARRLRAEPIRAIYSSDLQRAYRTADVIAHQLTGSVEVHISSAWRELSFGEWEGLTYAQIAEQYPHRSGFFADPLEHAPPQGETLNSLAQRVRAGFAQIVADAQGKRELGDFVLVSHGGPLRVLLSQLLSMPLQRQWQLQLDPGSLSAVTFIPDALDVSMTTTLVLLNVHSSRTAEWKSKQEGQR